MHITPSRFSHTQTHTLTLSLNLPLPHSPSPARARARARTHTHTHTYTLTCSKSIQLLLQMPQLLSSWAAKHRTSPLVTSPLSLLFYIIDLGDCWVGILVGRYGGEGEERRIPGDFVQVEIGPVNSARDFNDGFPLCRGGNGGRERERLRGGWSERARSRECVRKRDRQTEREADSKIALDYGFGRNRKHKVVQTTLNPKPRPCTWVLLPDRNSQP